MPYFFIFHHTEQLVIVTILYIHIGTKAHRHTHTARERVFCIIYFQISSVFSCVSVALRIPLSFNNLWGACVFPQPETMISALLAHATTHLSSRSLSLPPCLSSLVFAALHHIQVVSGTSLNRARLSWSFSLTPGWNGRCEVLNISFYQEWWKGTYSMGEKIYKESLIRALQAFCIRHCI